MNTTKHYGPYGGQYVAETLMGPLNELAAAYLEAKNDPEFQREFTALLKDYVGRESPITVCNRLSAKLGGATIVLKREPTRSTTRSARRSWLSAWARSVSSQRLALGCTA